MSPEARARVLAAIAATGYTPNVAARNLRGRRTMMVLVMVPNLSNSFFAEVLRGIDDELVASGYGMIIGNLNDLAEREPRYVDLVFSGQVDGVLLLNGSIPAGNGKRMSDAGVPMATICVAIPGSGLPFVMVDDHAAARAAVEHLAGLGHQRFGYVSGPAGNNNEIGRRAGFSEGLASLGFDPADAIYWPGDFTLGAGVLAGRDFLRLSLRPTAVFAASDRMAIAFMKTIRSAGVRVPEDVSIVGFDGIEFADFVEPALTTIRQPRHEIGRAGARVLLQVLHGRGEGVEGLHIAAPLNIGGSTAPARVG